LAFVKMWRNAAAGSATGAAASVRVVEVAKKSPLPSAAVLRRRAREHVQLLQLAVEHVQELGRARGEVAAPLVVGEARRDRGVDDHGGLRGH
jgi:hypothetical protein